MSVIRDVVAESVTNSGTANTSTAINLGGSLTENGLAYRGFVSALGGTKTGVPVILVRGTGNDWQTGEVTITDSTTDTAQFTRIDASSNSGSAISFDSGSKLYLTNSAGSIARSGYRRQAESPTTSGITATVNTDYAVDISGLTADRNFTLPSGNEGDYISIKLDVGDDTYSLVLIGDTGVSINGGSSATEWSRLFIDKEKVVFRCTSSSNWDVEHDGRIPCSAGMSLSASSGSVVTGEVQSAWQVLDWDTVNRNIGNIAVAASDVFTIRRANNYVLSGYAQMGSPADATRFYIGAKLNTTDPSAAGTYMAASHASHSGTLGLSGSSDEIACVAGDDITMVIWHNNSGTKTLTAQTFMSIREIL